jgi:hypothetical protein
MEIPGNLRLQAKCVQDKIQELLALLEMPLDPADQEDGWTPHIQAVVVADLREIHDQITAGHVIRRHLARDLDSAGIVEGSRLNRIAELSLRLHQLCDAIEK